MYTIVETDKIGKNFVLGDFSIIRKDVTIGDNVEIGEYCLIGNPPSSVELLDSITERLGLSRGLVIGNNVRIHAYSAINVGKDESTIIEDNVVMLPGVFIGHDCHVHKSVRIMARVLLNGHVTIGENTIISAGTVIRNRINIGKNCMIGMGSNVVKDIPDGVIAYGNPCVVIDKNTLPVNAIRKILKEVKKVF